MIAPTVNQAAEGFAAPAPEARPMMRWWWFGPDVATAELERELRAMRAAGIGGVEVAFVYPLRRGSPQFLSEPMRTALRHAAAYARDLGLRFDLTLGSGWPYGGAHIGPEHASRALHWQRRDIVAGASEVELSPDRPDDELVAAYLGDGRPSESWQQLPTGDRVARLPPGRGPGTVLVAWSRLTGQQVKRASAGAEGPVLDHLSAAATRHHLEVVGEALLEAVPAALLGSVFCDSLEVYGAGWTPRLPEEFRRRRGYDLLPLLYRLQVDEPGADRLRIDVGRTLTDLVEENFIAVCRDWAREHGVAFRLQGYGEPPVTMSSNRYADLIEGEGRGWTELTQLRWASSAGHLYGRDVVSSEVWTWVHSPSFRATPLDLKGEAHEHLLAGSTQLVGHGWPYSPPEVPGVGWYFYAAGALDDRNPWWPAMGHLMDHLTRLSWLLRQGEAVAYVALYLPTTDLYAAHGAGFDLWKACRDHIGPEIPAAIRRGGYDYDVIDDDALEALDPASVPVVVLPAVTRIPEPTRRWLDAVREAGGSVLAVDSPAYPAGVDATVASFADVLGAVLAPDVTLDGDGGEIGIVHRRLADGDLYLVANTGPQVRTVDLVPRTVRAHLAWWDPATGRSRPARPMGRAMIATLHPYEARVLVGSDAPIATDDARDADGSGLPLPAEATDGAAGPVPAVGATDALPLTGPWTVAFADTAPTEVTLPHRWEDDRPHDSGAGTYSTVVEIGAAWLEAGSRVTLDLGPCRPATAADGNGYRARVEPPVREIAEVAIGDRPVGVLWDPPYRLDVTDALRPGRNTVRVTVRNTAAGAVAADEHAAAIVAESHRHYGARFQQQDLDRAMDQVSSGLQAVPTLRRARPYSAG